MRQISKHDVNKLSVAKLKTMLPFEVVADGEVIFVAYDVNKLSPGSKATHEVNKVNKLAERLSPWQLKYPHSYALRS